MNKIKIFCLLFLLIFLTNPAFSQRKFANRPTDSGGALSPEQSAFDVKSYDINVRFNPAEKSISGIVTVSAQVKNPIEYFVLDLDTPLEISKIEIQQDKFKPTPTSFERRGGKIWIKTTSPTKKNSIINATITYSGKPRIAPNPPWVGGLLWEKTADGSPWITVTCQTDGSDVWFPSKDHPSDEPETVTMHYTVPENLYAAGNGKLQKIDQNPDGTKTYHWKMSNPVNSYNIIPNIAPYKLIEQNYTSIDGKTFPIIFYALPESVEKAKDIVAQTAKFVAFFEKYVGPYPFRAEKLGIAQTPHLGMEHSTIIAYGNNFRNNEHGFDSLMLHELGHEWWGNLVTNVDWKDMWLHEGFQTFMDNLYVEEIKGKEAYLKAIKNSMRATLNKKPVAPREPQFAYQIYLQAPDYVVGDPDIYVKGGLVLHTLRYLIGDDAFFRSLRKMAYPTKKMESYTDGRQTRFATTDDFLKIAEKESKMKLSWFFEVYLRQPALPKLNAKETGETLELSWETPNNLPFDMPVEVAFDGKIKRVEMKNGKAVLPFSKGQKIEVDPNSMLLKAK